MRAVDRRRGFTVAETIIAILVSLVVMGAAWSVFSSSTQAGRKAQGMQAGVQAGAMVLHALTQDLANVDAGPSPAQTVAVVGTHPDVRTLKFKRRPPASPIAFASDAPDTAGAQPVEYRAERDPTSGLFSIARIVDEDPATAVKFTDVRARDVRFSLFSFNGRYFVRASFLLEGEPAADGVSAANRAKPVLLTNLFVVPVQPGEPTRPAG